MRTNFVNTGLYITGFEGPFRYDGQQNEFIISHGFRFQEGGVSVHSTSPRLTVGTYDGTLPPSYQERVAKTIGNGIDDPGVPTDADYIPEPILSETTTLAELGLKLNALMPKPGPTISVNPALGLKPVTLFGESALTPRQILRDVSILYGLRIQRSDKDDAYLTMASTVPVRNLEEAGPAVERMYPQPWQRALLGGAERAEKVNFEAELPEDERQNKPILLRRELVHMNAPASAKDAIFYAAVHRLRVLIEPELKKSADGRFPMSKMTDEEKRLFVLMYACDSLQGVDAFAATYPPQGVLDRSKLIISGMLDAPTGGSNFYFGYLRDGRFEPEGGAQMPTPKEYVGTNTYRPDPTKPVPLPVH